MGKFGCRLYCWGCGGCCIITGVVMGILSSMLPGSMIASLQESLFDLAYIDDTSQTEAEGLLADAGMPIAESDAFKAWGKALSDGFDDCMKADFAFDWGKTPEDCVEGLHPTFHMWNATNPGSWGGGALLQVQELGGMALGKNQQFATLESTASYWDESGKARFRLQEIYGDSAKCSLCPEFVGLNEVLTPNIWFGIFSALQLSDGWVLSHAASALPTTGHPNTLKSYLTATDTFPMDPHAEIPLPTKNAARMVDFQTFLYTPNAAKLGTVNLGINEYASLRQYLWDMGGTLLTQMAPAYGVPVSVTPVLIKASAGGVLGWGAAPAWGDPISSAAFTFNFVNGILPEFKSVKGEAGDTAFIEAQMSSTFYHEGLGYVTQHYEANTGPTTNSHACAWDPDCAPDCSLAGTDTCSPSVAAGYDGGKIPGMYFGSPKGAPGFPEFTNFVGTYYLKLTMKSSGRVVVPARYAGANTKEGSFDFEGYLVHSTFKAAAYYRRLENCNYAGGRDLGGGKVDSQGIDCNSVKDTSPIGPFFGIPLYWTTLIRDSIAPGWDPALANADDGAGSITINSQVSRTSCVGNKFCSDDMINDKGAAFTNFLHYAYEPHLGLLIDVSLAGGLAFKWIPSPRYPLLGGNGYKMMPLFWVWNYLHLPGAFNMDLAKLQTVPGALNGLYFFLLGQCLISLVGGVACCFCGV